MAASSPLEAAPGVPGERGYRMPAEWEPQESVWLAWPRDPVTWPDRLPQARQAYLAAMRAIAPHQRVDLVVHPDEAAAARRAVRTAKVGNVAFHVVEHQDSWIRDYGPTYVTNASGGRLAIKWRFNAWGGKYDALLFDDGVVDRLARPGAHAIGADEVVHVPFVLEGGSIESDGQGSILTTEQCLLNANRNPHLDQPGIERLLMDHLGARRILWLQDGIEGDDTDGHVDDIARFVAPGRVAAVVAPPGHPDHHALAKNLERLRGMTDAAGRRLEVVSLPVPPRLVTDEGETLPASHANFLVTNAAVLVPTFGGASDAAALEALRGCFPGRAIIGLPSADLVWGMGSIHCLSQQMPSRAAPQPPAPARARAPHGRAGR